ncbi:MAG: phosphoribosylglycinamide formyltransferase [Lachnospiraceae bacterium]|nr:phosphoribosylglycinamide formyltransferase [Lachnospiraceae bacterium]
MDNPDFSSDQQGKKAKIAVFVSGGGTNLQALIDAAAAGKMPHADLKLVISSKEGVYALERAKNAGIEAVAVPRKTFDSREAYEKEIIKMLEQEEIDLIVLAGFLSVLSEDFVKRYPERIINIHPSLIPSFCGDGFYGLKVHEEALKYGVKVTGATVHFVNEITDGGKIILQKAVDIEEGDTPETLQKRVMEQAEWVLLPRAVELVAGKLCES